MPHSYLLFDMTSRSNRMPTVFPDFTFFFFSLYSFLSFFYQRACSLSISHTHTERQTHYYQPIIVLWKLYIFFTRVSFFLSLVTRHMHPPPVVHTQKRSEIFSFLQRQYTHSDGDGDISCKKKCRLVKT